MHAGDEVGSVEHSRLDDVAGPAGRYLLGVLEDEAHLSGQLVTMLEEQPSRAEQHRRVTVVPAGVHHTRARRDVGKDVLLENRQRVDVGAEHDDLARPGPVETGDDGGAGGTLDLQPAERPQRLLHESGRLVLLERELGMGVQMAPPSDRTRFEVVRDEA